MEMKTKRIINAAFWAAVAIALSVAVVIEWAQQGAPVQSLVLGAAFYLSASAAFCGVIDQTIQGK